MSITQLFGQNVQTKISIINYLFKQKTWVTTDELAEETGNERKTILKYLSEIEEAINDFGEPDLEMMSSKGRGVFLSAKSVNEINRFIFWITDDSLFSKLFRTFFFETKINLTKWSYENFISESTTRRKIAEIKELLLPFDIQIVSKKGVYSITGDEKQIRYIYYYLFWNLYKGRAWPFQNIPEEKVSLLLQEIANKYYLSLPHQIEKQLTYIFAINITRYFQSKCIKLGTEWDDYKTINRTIIKEFEITKIIQKYFHIPIDEIHFLLFYLQSKYSFYNSVYSINRAISHHEKLNTEVFSAYHTFAKEFKKSFQLDVKELDEKEHLFIKSHAFSMHYKAFLFPGFKSELVEEESVLESHFPVLNKKMKNFCSNLYDKTNNLIYLETDYLAIRYAQLLSFFKPLCIFEKKINIYFETDLPALPSRMLKNQISSLFQNHFNINIYTMEDLFAKNISLNEVDIVISTNETRGLKKDFHEHPIIYLKEGISKYDMENIYDELKKITNR